MVPVRRVQLDPRSGESARHRQRKEARKHHGRFFITDGYAMNLPPWNLILQGTTDEILPSEMSAADFDAIWAEGEDISAFTPPPPT